MVTRFFLAAASAIVLVSAQAQNPDALVQGCTTNSFAIPSWFVEEFKYSGSPTSGSASFRLLNRATSSTADLACDLRSGSWNPCAIHSKSGVNETLQASIQFQKDTAQIRVDEAWTCSDRNGTQTLRFKASGTESVALSCTTDAEKGQLCGAVNSPQLIKASLESPVAITPVYVAGPPGHDAAGCTAGAQNPTWVLSAIYYKNQAGDVPAPSRDFTVVVTNPSIDYQSSCYGRFTTEAASAGIVGVTCSGSEFGSQSTGRYRLSTAGSFDPATLRFTLNQTWYCDDTNPGKPFSITGTVSEVLPLDCTTVAIPGTINGTETTCMLEDKVTVKGKLLSANPLPPYSISDPVPSPDGCTVSSLLRPQWTISSLKIDSKTAAAGVGERENGSLSFNIILRTARRQFPYPIEVSQGERETNSSWFACDIVPPGDIANSPQWPDVCSFQYSATKKELILKADWICTDLDPVHPILFSGLTTTTVNTTFTCETFDDLLQCQTTEPTYSWNADISNVTWRSESSGIPMLEH